jgi:hypothetical protein
VEDRPHANGEEQPQRPSDAQLLAALRRAVGHRLPAPGPAPLWMLLEQLAIPPRSAAARELRRRLPALLRRGLLAAGREHGVGVWSLTAAGERALRSAGPQRLPESPQHREWGRARTAAEQELPRFRARLAATLQRAELMLAGAAQPDPEGPAGSGAPSGADWLELGRALAGDCRRLGSAWHCLHEWPEPEDARAEPAGPQRARLAALRNIRLWREPD